MSALNADLKSNDTSQASTDLRSIGSNLDATAATVAADPNAAARLATQAADARRAADALDAGNIEGFKGGLTAYNADAQAVMDATNASTVPGC